MIPWEHLVGSLGTSLLLEGSMVAPQFQGGVPVGEVALGRVPGSAAVPRKVPGASPPLAWPLGAPNYLGGPMGAPLSLGQPLGAPPSLGGPLGVPLSLGELLLVAEPLGGPLGMQQPLSGLLGRFRPWVGHCYPCDSLWGSAVHGKAPGRVPVPLAGPLGGRVSWGVAPVVSLSLAWLLEAPMPMRGTLRATPFLLRTLGPPLSQSEFMGCVPRGATALGWSLGAPPSLAGSQGSLSPMKGPLGATEQ
ncbi:tetra-peptide repeat homeobox protein 1-like [Homarus americanus]|uniref:tetra-peptide repeat homeobox protein 1-like n=1 Tax=Homarus americanus TaxID=6706 RepID=UPI001C47BB5B|nr:tetra-peptide repeat homeobox protein 1-like [Homarus americanus]